MILTDDDFATIVEAVEEGRTIFSNLRRVVFFLITTNLGEILTLAAGLALGMPLPLTAVMILWINLVTDGACTIPLGIEPGHGSVLRQRPRPPSEGILGGGFIKRIFIFAPMMAAGTLFLFNRELGGGEVHARTMAFNALAAFQWFQAVSSRSLTSSVFSVGFFRNRWLWAGILTSVVLQVLATQTGLGQGIFGVQALSASNWLWITAVASSVLVVDELLKLMKFYGNRNG
jgi:Ca2+-transporting ATPase